MNKRTGAVPHGGALVPFEILLFEIGHILHWSYQGDLPGNQWTVEASTDGNPPWFFLTNDTLGTTSYDATFLLGDYFRVSCTTSPAIAGAAPFSNVLQAM